MVHGVNILGRYLGRVPVNQKLVINNYNYSQPPMLSFMNRPYDGYPYCNDYYYGRDPYTSYYATGGAYTLGYLFGSGAFSGIGRGIKNFFNWIGRGFTKAWNWITGKNKKETTYVPAGNNDGAHNSTNIPNTNGNGQTVQQNQAKPTETNSELTLVQNENDGNDENVYSSSVRTPINNMRSAKNSYDLLMAINDASMELTGLSENITTKTDAFMAEYNEINGEDYISKTKEQEKTVKNLQNEYNEFLRQENVAQANYNKAYSDVQQAGKNLSSIVGKINIIRADLRKTLTEETKNTLNLNLQTLNTAKINAERDLAAKEKLLAEKKEALDNARAKTQLANTILEKEKQTLKEMNAKKAEIEQMEKDKQKLDKVISNQEKRLQKLSKRENNKMYRNQVRETRNDNKAQDAADKGNVNKTNRKENIQSDFQTGRKKIEKVHIDLYNIDK